MFSDTSPVAMPTSHFASRHSAYLSLASARVGTVYTAWPAKERDWCSSSKM